MPKVPRPGQGQGMLFEGQPGQAGINSSFGPNRFDRRNAFARAVRPDYWGIDPASYLDITDHMMSLVAPDNLRPSLIDVPADPEQSPCAVSYYDPQVHRRHNIALTPGEYSIINRGVINLARHALNRTLAARPAREEFSGDQAAAQRSGVHSTEERLVGMETYRNQTLQPRIELLDSFLNAVRHPGFAWRKEADMRVALGIVHDQIFDEMFVALRQQRQWTPEQEQLARRTLDRRLFLERRSNEHIMHWRDMLAFNQEYLLHKLALFSDRIADSKRYIRKHG